MNSYSSDPALSIDAARPGDALAPLIKRPTQVEVVLFCAAIRNYHRYHYDRVYTRGQGIDDIIVPGFLLGNWCIEAASRGFGEPVHIHRLKFRNMAMAYVGGSFAIEGRVDAVDDGNGRRIVSCRIEVSDDAGRLVTSGRVDVTKAPDARSGPIGSEGRQPSSRQ